MSKHNNNEMYQILVNVEVALGKIGVHLEDIKADVAEIKHRNNELEKKVEELERFKSKVLGGSAVLIPIIAFMAAVGHDIIKKFMGWM